MDLKHKIIFLKIISLKKCAGIEFRSPHIVWCVCSKSLQGSISASTPTIPSVSDTIASYIIK